MLDTPKNIENEAIISGEHDTAIAPKVSEETSKLPNAETSSLKDESVKQNKGEDDEDELDEDEEDMDMADEEIEDEDEGLRSKKKARLETGMNNMFELPEFTRKDKTLQEILEMMDDNPPIIPDAVIDFYLMKNGMNLKDVRIKRLLALATQKFISDIATDAYEYSRIRSATAVYNANNGQAKARQLLMGQQQQQQQQEQQNGAASETGGAAAGTQSAGGNTAGFQQQAEKEKVVLTVNDLSSAVAEYGLNISKPDFYR